MGAYHLNEYKYQTWLEQVSQLNDVYAHIKDMQLPMTEALPKHLSTDQELSVQKFAMSWLMLRRHIYSVVAQLKAQLVGEETDSDFEHVDFLSDLENHAVSSTGPKILMHPSVTEKHASEQLQRFFAHELKELRTLFIEDACDDDEEILAAKIVLGEFEDVLEHLFAQTSLEMIEKKFVTERNQPDALRWCAYERFVSGKVGSFHIANDGFSQKMVS